MSIFDIGLVVSPICPAAILMDPGPPDRYAVPEKCYFGRKFVCEKNKMLLATYNYSNIMHRPPGQMKNNPGEDVMLYCCSYKKGAKSPGPDMIKRAHLLRYLLTGGGFTSGHVTASTILE
jgi:hypothetical protein